MNIEQVEQKKRAIVEQFGPWASDNLPLGNGLYTIGEEATPLPRLNTLVQLVADISNQPIEKLSFLDLACLEGVFSLEFALQGAKKVVGIEGREANVAKAQFVKEVHGLDNLSFFQDDVRHLSRKKYGSFDVVICSGIFYHLNAPDNFHLIEKVAEVCDRLAIIDTHVSLAAAETQTFKGKEYAGISVLEHYPDDTDDAKLKRWGASLDNLNSFWLTRPSLYNLLREVGFTSVYEVHVPRIEHYRDRLTLVALKGQPQTTHAVSSLQGHPVLQHPQEPSQVLYDGHREALVKAGLSDGDTTFKQPELESYAHQLEADWQAKCNHIRQLEAHIRTLESSPLQKAVRLLKKPLKLFKL